MNAMNAMNDGYGIVEVETFGTGEVTLTASGLGLNGDTATCTVAFTRADALRLAWDIVRAALRA